MLKQKLMVLVAFLFFHCYESQAQEEFKPSGNPFARIFFNFHYNPEGSSPAFDITRAYFGYKYNISEKFSGEITLDVGKSEVKLNDSTRLTTSLELTAFLKIAALMYESGNLQLDFGMIGLKHFKIQEKFWGYRYIEESFQDLYDLAPSADLGVSIEYKFHPIFSADLTIRNGEGYKKLQSDDALNTGLGLTLIPFKGMTVRGFYDYVKNDVTQYTIAHFIGFQNKWFSAGTEYNTQINNKDKNGQDLSGYSLFTTIFLNEQFKLFGRYDDLYSNTLQSEIYSWNYQKDGTFIISGVEYTPLSNVQVALNYQGWTPENEELEIQNYIFLNFQFTF